MLKGFEKLKTTFHTRVHRAAHAGGKFLRDRMVESASLTDHTTKELARMGHPYSRRHPVHIHSPDYLVHKQTGTLAGAIEDEYKEEPDKVVVKVGVDTAKAPHAPHVIFGTAKMVARDFVTGTLRTWRKELAMVMRNILSGKEM